MDYEKSEIILHLPEEIIEMILSYLSFEEISKSRLVCRKFLRIGNGLLENGVASCLKQFYKLEEKGKKFSKENKKNDQLLDYFQYVHNKHKEIGPSFIWFREHFENYIFYPGKVIDEFVVLINIISNIYSFNSYYTIRITRRELKDQIARFDYMLSLSLKHFVMKIAPNVPSLEILGICFSSPEDEERKITLQKKICLIHDKNKNIIKITENIASIENRYNLYSDEDDIMDEELFQRIILKLKLFEERDERNKIFLN